MNATTEALGAPEWTMADAYGDIGSERYEASFKKAQALVERLTSSSGAVAPDRTEILARLSDFDEATTLISSLAAFVKCTGAKDSEDERVARGKQPPLGTRLKAFACGRPAFCRDRRTRRKRSALDAEAALRLALCRSRARGALEAAPHER